MKIQYTVYSIIERGWSLHDYDYILRKEESFELEESALEFIKGSIYAEPLTIIKEYV